MNPVRIAINREIDAIAFYEKAAERTRNAGGKQMFLSIVQDEKNHLEDIKGALKSFHLSDSPGTVKKRTPKAESVQGIGPDTDELEAIRIAIEREKELIGTYRKLLRGVKSEWERGFFERLIDEAEQYYAKLSNTYNFISASADWFMHEEYSITDGGTGWA